MDTISFDVNGKPAAVKTEGDRPLLEVLREDLALTGTKYGCGEGAWRAHLPVSMAGRQRRDLRPPRRRHAGRHKSQPAWLYAVACVVA